MVERDDEDLAVADFAGAPALAERLARSYRRSRRRRRPRTASSPRGPSARSSRGRSRPGRSRRRAPGRGSSRSPGPRPGSSASRTWFACSGRTIPITSFTFPPSYPLTEPARASLSGRQAGLRAPVRSRGRDRRPLYNPRRMATRVRRRRRKPHHPIWHKIAIPLGIVVALVLVAGGIAAAWAINVYNSAPALSSLKPVQKGRSSAIYAADGSLIGFIRSENVRQPLPEKRSRRSCATRRSRSRTRTSSSTAPSTTKASPAPPGRTCRPGPAGAGRLDDHPAAGPQPLHPQPGRHAEAKADRSLAGGRARGSPRQGLDPDPVPQQRAVRDGRRPDRGRRRGGLADLLLEAGQEARPDRGGAARRPAAGALRIQPVPRPEGGAEAAQRGAAGDERTGLHHRRRIPRSEDPRPRPQPGRQVPGDQGPVPLRPGAERTDRGVRDQHRPQRRAEGVHDDRSPTCRQRPNTRSKTTATSVTRKAAPPPASPRSTRTPARSSPSPRPKATPTKASSTTPGRRTASRGRRSRPSSSPPRSRRGSTRAAPTTTAPRRRPWRSRAAAPGR